MVASVYTNTQNLLKMGNAGGSTSVTDTVKSPSSEAGASFKDMLGGGTTTKTAPSGGMGAIGQNVVGTIARMHATEGMVNQAISGGNVDPTTTDTAVVETALALEQMTKVAQVTVNAWNDIAKTGL